MKQITILILIAAIGTQITQAQTKKYFGIEAGVGHIQRQDITLSPNVHSAKALPHLRVNYNWEKKLINKVEINFGHYQTTKKDAYNYISMFDDKSYIANRHSFTQIEINYSIGKAVYKPNDLSISTGLLLKNRYIVSSHVFAVFPGQFGYNFSHGIEAWGDFEYNLKENVKVHGGVMLPILAFVARNPYLIQNSKWMEDNMDHKNVQSVLNMTSNGTLRSWGKHQGININIGIRKVYKRNWSLGFKYEAKVLKLQDPNPYTSIENIFSLTTLKTLK